MNKDSSPRKAALLTWCYNNGKTNYGQILQCYAMQTVIQRLGYDSKVIRYRKKEPNEPSYSGFMHELKNDMHELCYRLKIVEGKIDIRIIRFILFIRKHIRLSRQCYTKKQVEFECRDYTALFCGSDQIWNPLWFDDIYALNFGSPAQKRIAYAPSGALIENESAVKVYEDIGKCLNRFDLITVREQKSVEILQKYTNKTITDVPDPTLLLSADDWNCIASRRRSKEPYIFCYSLGRLRPNKILVKRVMKKYGASKILFITSGHYPDENRQEESGPFFSADTSGPAEFIALIRDAEAVCTDSFHGLALSLIFQKQFYIFERNDPDAEIWASMLRQENLLKKVGITDKRIIGNISEIEKMKPIDYSNIKTTEYWKEIKENLLWILN